jgi:hypothetical protein
VQADWTPIVVIVRVPHAHNKQHEVDQVEPKSDRNSPMSVAHSAALPREVAEHMVFLVEKQTGSRMTAYVTVAQAIGTSADWLRKFIAGREAKEPGWITGWSILDQYSRICNRVEAAIETERARTLALKERVDAANATVNRVVESTSGKTTA